MSRFSVDARALDIHSSSLSLLVDAAEAARLISLHQPPQTAAALTSLCERLVAELVQVAAQFDDIATSTHLAARSYGLTETALLDRITVLDRR